MRDQMQKLKTRQQARSYLAFAGASIGLFLFVFFVVGYALDVNIDNQNTMLCNSAKVTGNVGVVEKCADYYQTNDIKTVREKL